jgi:hypothetical protein
MPLLDRMMEDKRRQQEDLLRHETLTKAVALFEQNPEYPGALVQISDTDQEIEARKPDEAKERLSEARLEHLMKFIDVRGKAYLRLVTDLESAKAFTAIMDDFARATWWQLSGGVPIEAIAPTSPFAEPIPTQLQRDRIVRAAHHWVMEGYRRLESLRKQVSPQAEPTRRGYRKEVTAWMKRKTITSQSEAARELGISIDVLKSIMSDRGRARYGEGTLERVLETIQPPVE